MSFDATLRRAFDSRLVGAGLVTAVLFAPAPTWQRAAPLPVARTEVAAARVQANIFVVGGYLANGESSARVDMFLPEENRWMRRRDLPVGVNHAAAVGHARDLYVVGGYSEGRRPLDTVFVIGGGRTRMLRMPEPRAAAGAAIIRNTLYVVGGVGPTGLARRALAYNIVQRRWHRIPGPTPREHLAVVAVQANGRLYALAGRTSGLDTNVRLLETWRPGERRWTRLPAIPSARGGTGAAVVERTIVSVGGEAPSGTIASVYAYNTSTRRWRRLADLPTPRHGLGVAARKNTVYVIGGGPQPGLTVSGANEYITLP